MDRWRYTPMSQTGPFSFAAYAPKVWPRRMSSRVVKRLCQMLVILVLVIVTMTCLVAVIRPSYTHPPSHYKDVVRAVTESGRPGRLNPRNEKIFIAAILYDPKGDVARGGWGNDVLELIDLLGPGNTFLSVYESDSGDVGAAALKEFESRVTCNRSIISEPTLVLENPDLVNLPDGTTAVKRIAFLAAARNRALDPLAGSNMEQFDKILYVNDVIFEPVEAVQLLLSTNMQTSGKTSYRSACAVDFKSPFLFYDTFATRDHEGWSTGVTLFPWFSGKGDAESRQDILSQKDAVRVKSCWGGMVAFDAKYFQLRDDSPTVSNFSGLANTMPIRFRAEPDLYWEQSECCLVHADLSTTISTDFPDPSDSGIYMNPYVRTAYSKATFRWLPFVRRIEILMLPLQMTINTLAGLPYPNERRTTKPGESIWKTVFDPDATSVKRSWKRKVLPANPGGFCGTRNLLVRRLHPIEGDTEHNWVNLGVPPGELEEEANFAKENPT